MKIFISIIHFVSLISLGYICRIFYETRDMNFIYGIISILVIVIYTGYLEYKRLFG